MGKTRTASAGTNPYSLFGKLVESEAKALSLTLIANGSLLTRISRRLCAPIFKK